MPIRQQHWTASAAFRARAKRHALLVTLEVPSGLADALADSGFLAEWDTEDPTAIRKAIERILTQLVV